MKRTLADIFLGDSCGHSAAVQSHVRGILGGNADFVVNFERNPSLGERKCLRLDLESDNLIRRLTGFRNGDDARDAFESCGGDQLFADLSQHRRQYEEIYVQSAVSALKSKDLGPSELIESIGAEFERQHCDYHSTRNRESRLPAINMFLLPFVYVFGGIRMDVIGLLPYYNLKKDQVSLLIHNATPLVVKSWASQWAFHPSLQWCLKNASSEISEGQEMPEITIFADGMDVPVQKSMNQLTQKAQYGKKSEKHAHHALRSILFSTRDRAIVSCTSFAGSRLSEQSMVRRSKLLQKLESEAAQSKQKIKVNLIVDRGFYWLKGKKKSSTNDSGPLQSSFKWLEISLILPVHLNAPSQGRRGGVQKRSQFEQDEVFHNVHVASERQVNERAVGLFKLAKMMDQRQLHLDLVPMIDDFLNLAWAIANYSIPIPE